MMRLIKNKYCNSDHSPSYSDITNATLTLLRINGESHQKFIRISIAKERPGELRPSLLGECMTYQKRIYGESVSNKFKLRRLYYLTYLLR